ncbi:hypothetical protein [Conexibacter sp. CPCC 206217]|uniref:hypothetical protein n=1 Tax=Conexibacter sp. CPCC 206217 TaxID=3064574 RepID=UPI0027220653|nr:hypothetical protein [Conexibacter sp. CPCC 206217]MDO8210216.1 hypothetical protein [Conexibacter sp. CPCC 206217]
MRRWKHHPARRPAFAAVLVFAVVGLGANATSASAAKVAQPEWRKPWASRIVNPRTGSVVTNGALHVTAEVAPGVREFRAWIDDSRVTSAFRPAGNGSLREATLRVGSTPALRWGRHRLSVETLGRHGQRWWTERTVVLARPGSGLVTRASAQRVPGAGANIAVTTASAKVRVSLRVDGGRSVALPGSGRRHVLHLTADAGLHPGVNRIRVRALNAARGRYEVRRMTVRMPTPVAGAGAGRRARTGEAVRFSAARSKAAGLGRTRYRWTIARRPAGSHARLHRAATAHPTLHPDRIGRYVLRLTVLGMPIRRGAHAAALQSDSATTTLDATPDDGALGVPVDTITSSGIQVGASQYANPASTNALQLLVLSRSTLASVSNASYANSDAGASALLSAVQGLTSDALAIIAKPSATTNNATDTTANATINKALAQIGVQPASQVVTNGTTPCDGAEPCSVFSAIGVPGSPVGQGSLNDGLSGLQAPASGGLHGYFQENLDSSGYTFVNTERVPLDTGDPAANPAVVTAGSNEPGSPFPLRTYTSDAIPSGSSGFFVLALSAGNLGVYAQQTFSDDAAGLAAMHTMLADYAQRKALIVVRSIGAVARVNTPAWDDVASDLQLLGASKYYFNMLNGTSSAAWAQVAPGSDPSASTYPAPYTRFASAQHSNGGRISGLLARDDLGQLYAKESVPVGLRDPTRPLAGTLAGIVSLPQTGWPEDDWTTGEQNVESCIAAHIDPLGGLPTPIRSNYLNANDVSSWSTYDTKMMAAGYFDTLSSYTDCGPFTQSDFRTVVDQLDREWSAVPVIWAEIDNLQTVLNASSTASDEVASVALAVNRSVAGDSSRPARYDADEIASDALWALSTIPGFSEESNVINFVAASLGLASDLNQDANGSSASQTTTTAVNFATSLSQQLTEDTQFLAREREILLGDWTKLATAAENGKDVTNAAADWTWGATQAAAAADALMMSVRRESYETLFPTAYSLYRLQPGTGSLPTNPATYQCATLYNGYFVVWSPFSGIQQYGSVDLPTTASGTMQDWVYGQPDTSPLSKVNKTIGTPSASLLAAIFGNPSQGDPYQPPNTPLFNGGQFAIETYANAATNTITVTHSSAGEGKRSTSSICNASGS